MTDDVKDVRCVGEVYRDDLGCNDQCPMMARTTRTWVTYVNGRRVIQTLHLCSACAVEHDESLAETRVESEVS